MSYTLTDISVSELPAATPPAKISERITSVDILRGVVMVLMAIDHVRVYSGIPAGGPTAGVFFTRWITHFCAPAFVFFAGTSAFLHGAKLGDKKLLAKYLVTRGLLLVVFELTVIRLAWTFNFDYSNFLLAGVIWILGWCMVLLAGLLWLPGWIVGVLGLAVMFLQQVFSVLPRLAPEAFRNSAGWIWEFIYPAGLPRLESISILYVLVPWIGVMAAGYGFGAIMSREKEDRRRICLLIGLTATGLFLLVGGIAAFHGSAAAGGKPALFRLLDQQKYPASQLYLLMTLGPIIALLPFAERVRGWLPSALSTFGRVPLFYYLLHIPLIHATALIVWCLRDKTFHSDWFATAPFVSAPPETRWSLLLLYVVFSVDIAILYFPCRWFASIKAKKRGGWASYL